MQRHYLESFSSHLGRPLGALVYGHAGAPVLVFPTSRGRFHQWEDFGMIEALRQPIEAGYYQLFCIDGIDNETWYNFDRPVSELLEHHQRYERYLLDELLPELRRLNRCPFWIATGTSFGAFHAANFAARFPEHVQRVVAMSGDFDSSKYLDDRFDPPAYFFNPVAYLSGIQPGPYLDRLRGVEFRLAVGAHDFCLSPSQRLHDLLCGLGVPSRLDIWGAEWIHDWPTWKVMARHYL